MLHVMPEVAPPPAGSRNAVVRVSEGYFLQLITLFTELTSGDIFKAVLLVAIVFANTEIIRRMDANAQAFAASDDTPPDEMRVPVSVYSLSRSLGASYETTRRYMNQLVEEGICEKVGPKNGVIVPARFLSSPRCQSISRRQHAQTMKFVGMVNQLSAVRA